MVVVVVMLMGGICRIVVGFGIVFVLVGLRGVVMSDSSILIVVMVMLMGSVGLWIGECGIVC